MRTLLLFALLFIAGTAFCQNDTKLIPITNSKQDSTTNSNESTFTIVEKMPVYPGGNEAMFQFISKNVSYPKEAIKNKIQGTVYVNFIIDETGQIIEAKVLRGIGFGCDEEAIRVVNMMPKWEPGTQRGKAVRVMYNLPIRFKL